MKEKNLGADAAAVVNDTPADTPERQAVPIEEAIRRIGRKKYIHTLMSSSFALIGADHDRESLIEKMRTLGVEESGPQATAMGHTLAIRKYPGSPLFIEARAGSGRVSKAKRAATTRRSEAK